MATTPDDWLADVERRAQAFASAHKLTYSISKREQSATFEIGCFLTIVDDYARQGVAAAPQNLTGSNEFRYLTSPSGNPQNFSWLRILSGPREMALRQQVRIRSHLHPEVTFTPDFVLLERDAPIEQRLDPDYAAGRRGLYAVDSRNVVAAFECKSLTGFPELFVSFLGMLWAAHAWATTGARTAVPSDFGHVAPTLFVGGVPSNLHRRIVTGLEQALPLNIVTGLHRGSWRSYRRSPLKRLAW